MAQGHLMFAAGWLGHHVEGSLQSSRSAAPCWQMGWLGNGTGPDAELLGICICPSGKFPKQLPYGIACKQPVTSIA